MKNLKKGEIKVGIPLQSQKEKQEEKYKTTTKQTNKQKRQMGMEYLRDKVSGVLHAKGKLIRLLTPTQKWIKVLLRQATIVAVGR